MRDTKQITKTRFIYVESQKKYLWHMKQFKIGSPFFKLKAGSRCKLHEGYFIN